MELLSARRLSTLLRSLFNAMPAQLGKTAQLIKDSLEYAPAAKDIRIAPGLVGWVTPENDRVCARCAGRVMARGVMMTMKKPLWSGSPGALPFECCVCLNK